MTCSAVSPSFAAVERVWAAMARDQAEVSVFLTPQWHASWWERFGGGLDLRLLVVGGEASPLGIAPMCYADGTLSFLGGTDLVDYHDFVFGASDPARFFAEAARCIDAEEWRTLDLTSIRETSPTLEHLPGLLRERGYRVSIEREDTAPGLALPASWDDYLARLTKKDRHELRRKLRRLERADGYRLVLSEPGSLAADVGALIDLMRESHEEKRGFMAPEREAFFRGMALEMSEAGMLRLFSLEVNGQTASAAVCFDFMGRRLLYNSGYSVAMREYSAGLLLKALTIRHAIDEGLVYYDFLRGDEPYKYDLGAADVLLYRVRAER